MPPPDFAGGDPAFRQDPFPYAVWQRGPEWEQNIGCHFAQPFENRASAKDRFQLASVGGNVTDKSGSHFPSRARRCFPLARRHAAGDSAITIPATREGFGPLL